MNEKNSFPFICQSRLIELSKNPGDLKFVDNWLFWILLNNTLSFLILNFSQNKCTLKCLQKRNNEIKWDAPIQHANPQPSYEKSYKKMIGGFLSSQENDFNIFGIHFSRRI